MFVVTFGWFLLAVAAFSSYVHPAHALISAQQAVQVANSSPDESFPSTGLVCSINITGNFTNAQPTNTTGSTNIHSAAINCTGGTLNFIGGPALKSFNDSFSGASYTLAYSLPGATIAIRSQTLTLVNSSFINLTPNAEASLILIHSNVTIQAANFSSNKQATAGAIRANDSSNIAIFDSFFLNNTGASGGAISIFNSSILVNTSTFVGNSGQQGGGLLFQNGSSSNLNVVNSLFMKNNATTGAGIFAQDCNQAILYNNKFMGNKASGSGGGVFQLNCGGALVLNALTSNIAMAGGGGYINAVDGLTLSRNEWTSNNATIGSGGLDLQSVLDASITTDIFTANVGQQGGGYFGTATNCSFTSCTFANNKASLNGGGIFRTQGSGVINNCLFQSNSAGKLGGAIYDSQVTGDITSNDFNNNTAGSSSASAIFRLQSSGVIASSNTGLSNNVVNQMPNSTSTTVAG